MSRKRLLAVTALAPWPHRGGFSLRAGHLLEHLAESWDITLIAVREGVAADVVPWDPSTAHAVTSVGFDHDLSPLPPSGVDLSPVTGAVDAALAARRHDAALLFNGVEFVAFDRDVFPPTVGDRIDCTTLEETRRVKDEAFLRPQVKALRKVTVHARYERRVVRKLDATIVVGERDARALKRLSGRGSVFVVPNGVDARSSPRFENESDVPTVAFTGGLSYYANTDAARHLAHHIWPNIRGRIPHARLVIAGRDPTREIESLGSLPGIEVRADVPDLGVVLEEAWVSAAPMRYGTGVKNKVLEAWAAGRPAVMTPIASNGLRLDDRSPDLVARSDEEFCERVIELLQDRESRHRLGVVALERARARHSWQASAASVSEILHRVVESSA